MPDMILKIEGMTCAACATRVERALASVPGVSRATVNFAAQKAYVRTEPASLGAGVLREAVRQAGYSAEPYLPEARISRMNKEGSHLQWRVVLGGFFTMPFFLQHLLMILRPFQFPTWLQFLLASIVYSILGWPFHRAALRGLRRGEVTMDTLVSLGSSAAFFSSLPALWGAAVPLYFDASAFILFFVGLGRSLEISSKRKAGSALESLMRKTPATAHVIQKTHQVDVPLEKVMPGDTLCVRPGEAVPVDGDLLEGKGRVDESLLTGESVPVEKRPGKELYAGTLNGGTTLLMRAGSVGAETRLAGILRIVEEAQGTKARAQKTADRVAAIFTPAVLALALLTALGWGLLGHAALSQAVERAVAVLVVACPCALGLAVPIALMAGVGLAARRGILIRNAQVLEKCKNLDVMVFDKTGTLTEGKPRLVDFLVLEGFEEEKLLRWAGALSLGTNHPLASAVLKEAMVLDLILPPAAQIVETPGAGIRGFVEGRSISLGTKAFIESMEGVLASPQVRANVEAHRQGGQTVSLLAVDNQVAAVLVMEDPPRADSREVVAKLRGLGLQVHLLTGDGEVVAERVGKRVGVDQVKASVTPEGKLNYIRELQAKGLKVAMVGDGINDAAALAAADLGIALGSGADAAKEAGDLVLMGADLSKVVEAVKLSRATFRVIRQNLFWAFGYNLLALPLAMLMPIPPVLAAAAMSFSSLSVTMNALRLYGKKF